MLGKLLVLICVTAVCSGMTKLAERRKLARERAAAGRIVGGEEIDISRAPYQVSLEAYGYTVCGASIISTRFVLSNAGYCTVIWFPGELTARVGSSTQASGGVAITVSNMYYHPSYDFYYFDYDVSVMELAEPLVLSDTVAIIPLGDTEPAAGGKVLVSGWGYTEGHSNSNTLRAVELRVVRREVCVEDFAEYNTVTARMFCAGEPGKSSCLNDQGGPVVQNGVQVGIVSWSHGCAREALPDVYVNIADEGIRGFIRNITNI